MGNKTKIEWTEYSWNPVRGCSRVSEGCRNCYAEGVANRFKGEGMPYEGLIAKGGQWNGKIKLVPENLDQPLRWKKPRRIFVNSMSDLFHENVPFDFIDEVFAIMALATHHTFQILTKRPKRMLEYFESFKTPAAAVRAFNVCAKMNTDDIGNTRIKGIPKGLPNVWLGVSVEDQETADERIPLLLQTPAAVRWISAEPLLAGTDIRRFLPVAGVNEIIKTMSPGAFPLPDHLRPKPSLDWVVVGGESGKNARPMQREWARSLRDQCQEAGVPFFMKQLTGEKGKPVKDIALFPEDLQIREYPQ